jgi:hypothetical protein
MTLFEWMEGREVFEFIGYLLCAFAIGALITGMMYEARQKSSIQATPIIMPGYDVLQLQQQVYESKECSACLPNCLNVYNTTRNFGRTIAAIEYGWIK